jgi:hypothetical protein
MMSRRDKRMEPVEKALNLRRLIVNADDFGFSEEVNEAIIRAHNEGVLTSTSLMVTGQAFDHAVRLASENPGLGVGIHHLFETSSPQMGPSGRCQFCPSGRGFKWFVAGRISFRCRQGGSEGNPIWR